MRASTWGLVTAAVTLFGGMAVSVPVDWSKLAAGVGHVLVAWGLSGVVTLVAGGVLVMFAVPRVRARVREHASVRAAGAGPVRPMPGWAIWVGLAVVVLVAAGAVLGLVAAFGSGSPQDKVRLEAIKLAGSIAVGTGGVAALVLAARRQRATELGLQQQEQSQRLQEQRAADARHDADERRVTELYTAAAGQLASASAPVRMAGLYALERLGQNNPNHRQTIVNLFCAYLRMPDPAAETEPAAESASSEESAAARQDGAAQPLLLDLTPALAEAAGLSLDGAEQTQQEHQVRLTAQHLLGQHLRADPDKYGQPTNPDFWGGADGTGLELDLTGAILHRWYFCGCWARRADFTDAVFHGTSDFSNARFHDQVGFNETHFHGDARFTGTYFRGDAEFNGAYFHDSAGFDGAYFHDSAGFDGAYFHDSAGFGRAHFRGPTVFEGVCFRGEAGFGRARFRSPVGFVRACFRGPIMFDEVCFRSDAEFAGAWARLDYDSPNDSTWPPGWTLQEVDPGDGRDGQWGEFVCDEVERAGGEESIALAPSTEDAEE